MLALCAALWLGVSAILAIGEVEFDTGMKLHTVVLWPLFVVAWVPGAIWRTIRDGLKGGTE